VPSIPSGVSTGPKQLVEKKSLQQMIRAGNHLQEIQNQTNHDI